MEGKSKWGIGVAGLIVIGCISNVKSAVLPFKKFWFFIFFFFFFPWKLENFMKIYLNRYINYLTCNTWVPERADICDHFKKWVVSFFCHIRLAYNNKAKLWAVGHGLITVRDMCIKFLNVTIDFTFVLTYLTSPRILALKLFPLNFFFFNCRMLFSREWVVHLHHIYCKANSITNGLTKNGREPASLLELYYECPFFVLCKYLWDFCV